jgi:hypothetical protein
MLPRINKQFQVLFLTWNSSKGKQLKKTVLNVKSSEWLKNMFGLTFFFRFTRIRTWLWSGMGRIRKSSVLNFEWAFILRGRESISVRPYSPFMRNYSKVWQHECGCNLALSCGWISKRRKQMKPNCDSRQKIRPLPYRIRRNALCHWSVLSGAARLLNIILCCSDVP